MNIHTEECRNKQAEFAKKREEWERQWPNYCRKCDGVGGHMVGDGWNEPREMEPCSCVEQCVCPRCGSAGLDPETAEGPCSACGWNYDDSAPGFWECWGHCSDECS